MGFGTQQGLANHLAAVTDSDEPGQRVDGINVLAGTAHGPVNSLAKAVNEWDGGLVLVSHDFRLISQVAKEIWVVEGGAVHKWPGTITEYKAHLKKTPDALAGKKAKMVER